MESIFTYFLFSFFEIFVRILEFFSLRTDLGYKMKNAYVVLKVNNVKYKGYTNSKGQFTFNLKKLTKKGYYIGYLQYGGDKYCYNALKLKVKITVK